jgi:putative transposase
MDAIIWVDAGLAVPEVCRELGTSAAIYCKRRSKYGGMNASMMAPMKGLEAENARLKRMYIEEKLKTEVVLKPSQKSGEAISQT